jgi:eukaryotic-like serine/threonine-protein kinase
MDNLFIVTPLVDTLKPQLQESQRYPSLVKYAKMVRDLLSIPVKVFEFDTVTVDAYGKTIEETIDRPRRQAYYYTEPLAQGVTLEMFYIPAGTFLMGSPDTEKGRDADEGPQHSVTVASFWMGKYPITQAQWKAVMGDNPSHFKGQNRPVESVSWKMATEFCEKLSKLTGKTYRLPSEAQWEYACRAGTTTPFYCGETITPALANYDGNYSYGKGPKGVYRKETTEVGSFPPNAFGLYDMSGNVWEWCADTWHKDYHGAPDNGSVWDIGGDSNNHPLRGGSWSINGYYCRCASRAWNYFFNRNYSGSFRLVLVECSAWTL